MGTVIHAGASGYFYKNWKGAFYPATLRAGVMLEYYSARLATVEINSSFYQLPRRTMIEAWARNTPPTFRFAIKAPRQITHVARLSATAAAESLMALHRQLDGLGEKCGPVLYQTPPYLKKDLSRLREFLALLPRGRSATFEFRHESWLDEDTYALLREHGAALCISQREDFPSPPFVMTANWGYLRLRMPTYTAAELQHWATQIADSPWREAWVYFMHEPTAPGHATALLELAGQAPASPI